MSRVILLYQIYCDWSNPNVGPHTNVSAVFAYNTHAVYCLKYVIAITAVPMLMPKISALFLIMKWICVVGARGQYRGQLYGRKLRVYKFTQPLMFWKVLGCTVALPIRDQETSPLANHHAKNL